MMVGLGVIAILCAVWKMIFLLRKRKDHLIYEIADKTSLFDYFLLLATVLMFLVGKSTVIQLYLLDVLLIIGIANTMMTFYYAKRVKT
ncbi:hypothetical protein [Thermoactinomyces sp. CICC 10521]|nr:hypothetical protein [Thermoactinomyces sp. CICC 10521]MBH8599057.1 hypothetical protein [Thermoactinomyces sp. CICC 10523]MBH8608012.1 hypothetical protein [Thermoactinomyces sp. CICC 10521]